MMTVVEPLVKRIRGDQSQYNIMVFLENVVFFFFTLLERGVNNTKPLTQYLLLYVVTCVRWPHLFFKTRRPHGQKRTLVFFIHL